MADPQILPLWPEGVPGPSEPTGPERLEDEMVVDVTIPTLTVLQPPPSKAVGVAAIVCPGGGYTKLAVDRESGQIGSWLNALGVTAFVLKYRIAPQRHPAPLRDVLRAVRLVRSRAAAWGLDPDRVGLFGASAGGHLTASAATLFDSPVGKTGAPLDAVSGRPDFVVLQYPVITMREPHVHAGSRQALLGDHPSAALVDELSVERQVTRRTPPAFILHTAEDDVVPLENSILFYEALRAAGVGAELHLFERGAHGFGIEPGLGPTSDWPQRCEEWMRSHGWLGSAAVET